MASPQPHRGPHTKLFVTAALSAALCAAPTAAAQSVSSTDVDVQASQNVQITPDPAPQAAPPVQPAPDPVPQPQPSSTSGGGEAQTPAVESPAPAEPAPAEPAPVADQPAASAPQAAAEPATPVAATAASDPPSQDSRPGANGRGDRGKPKPSEKDRSTPVDKVNPLPVISGVGPLVEGLRDRAQEAGPPLAIAALALLTLALTSGGFLLVATRRTGAWRT
jgi:hypothetical protein